MEVTREFLKRMDACTSGYNFWCRHCEGKPAREQIEILASRNFNWAAWLLVRILPTEDLLRFSIHCVESVQHIFTERFPKDTRVEKLLEVAKDLLKGKTECNRKSAYRLSLKAHREATTDRNALNDSVLASYVLDAAGYMVEISGHFPAYATVYFAGKAIEGQIVATEEQMLKLNRLIEYGISLIKVENNVEDSGTPTNT